MSDKDNIIGDDRNITPEMRSKAKREVDKFFGEEGEDKKDNKIKKYVKNIGRKIVERALQLYSGYYSEEGFWNKIKKYTKKAGRQVVELSFQLYYVLRSPETPGKEKAVILRALKEKSIILGALAYFIFPIDAIPDILPGGYVDDLGVLILAVSVVARYITDEVKSKAKIKADKLFGEEGEDKKE